MRRTEVLIVDDSAVVRQVVKEVLERDPSLHVYATAANPVIAMERMADQWPDVIVLDIEMPRMDGITFLKQIMRERPTPILICSTLTDKGARVTLDALDAGAVSIVTKPQIGLKQFLQDSAAELTDAVKSAALAKVGALRPRKPMPPPGRELLDVQERRRPATLAQTTERIVAMGTSTGGTQALEQILRTLPRMSPGIVVVQHMPEKFTAAFAARLDQLCEISVREAQHNDRVLPGRALIAPGGRHLSVRCSGAQYYVDVSDGPLIKRHRPSVDVLFRSVARAAGPNALGIIMTGMGDDGALGMLEMYRAGAVTLGQDEESCVVYGMPKEAVRHGAVRKVVPLDSIADEIRRWGRGSSTL